MNVYNLAYKLPFQSTSLFEELCSSSTGRLHYDTESEPRPIAF